jgi:hypothetical protein
MTQKSDAAPVGVDASNSEASGRETFVERYVGHSDNLTPGVAFAINNEPVSPAC